MRYRQRSFLLISDIYENQEQWLQWRYGSKLKSDVFKSYKCDSMGTPVSYFMDTANPIYLVSCLTPDDMREARELREAGKSDK